MGLSSFKFVQWAPKDASFLQQSAFWPFKVVRGHPGSWFWYQSKACSSFSLSWGLYKKCASRISVEPRATLDHRATPSQSADTGRISPDHRLRFGRLSPEHRAEFTPNFEQKRTIVGRRPLSNNLPIDNLESLAPSVWKYSSTERTNLRQNVRQNVPL